MAALPAVAETGAQRAVTPTSRRSTPTRGVALLLVCLLAPLAGGACGRREVAPAPAPPAPPDTAVIAYGIDMRGVNELVTGLTGIQTALFYFSLFLPLLEEQADYQEGPPTFAPRLATSYEFSPDRLRLTFHLREDVVWSDGTPITAEDVRWTWQAQTDPGVAWNYAESKARIADVEVVDLETVVFHFREAYATQLLDAVAGVILPKHAWSALPFTEWRAQPQWFQDHLVVSGPFTLESWEPQQRIVLRRNERYYEPGLPRLERVVWELAPDYSSQLALLRAGEADLVEAVQPADAEAIAADPDLEILSYKPRQYVNITWNLARPPLDEVTVRRALTLGIDRQAIIDALYYGYAELSTGPFNSDVWAHADDIEPWPYDPEAARRLLAEAGFEDRDGDGIVERGGEPLRIELLTNSENEIRRDIQVMVQDQLQRIGVAIEPATMEFNTLLARQEAHEFDAVVTSYAIDTSLDLSYFFHTSAIDGGWNFGSYSSPELDATLDAIAAEIDQRTAEPLYHRLQEILHRDQPMTFLYEPLRLVAIDDDLEGVDPNAISTYFHLRRWHFSAEDDAAAATAAAPGGG